MSEQLAVQLSEQAAATASATLQAAEAFVVCDTDTFQAAGEHMVTIKSRWDAVEAKRVDTKEDALSLCKKIDALFKPPLDLLTKARGVFAAKRQAWKDEETKRAEEATRVARELVAKEQARLDKLARERAERALAKGNEDRAAEILATVPQVAVPVFAPPEMPKTRGVSDREPNWKFRITDASLIPRDYLCPDEKLIGKYGRTMKDRAKIPGVEFYPEPVTAVKGASW